MKCTSKLSGKAYAVKLMTDVFDDIHYLKQLVREIHIMRKLSIMPSNIFTTKLHDVIITRGLDGEKTKDKEGLFLIMDYVESDIKKVIESIKYGTVLSEEHIVTILYNILCSVNFLHSANLIHRDLKPDNLLINSSCEIKIADFGLSRPLEEIKDEKSMFKLKADLRKTMVDYSKMDDTPNQAAYKSRMS